MMKKKVINIDKAQLLGGMFYRILKMQKAIYPITKLNIMYHYIRDKLKDNANYNEEVLEKLSYQIEPLPQY